MPEDMLEGILRAIPRAHRVVGLWLTASSETIISLKAPSKSRQRELGQSTHPTDGCYQASGNAQLPTWSRRSAEWGALKMIAEELKSRVTKHYAESTAPLMLSRFGQALRVEKLWPIEGESRSLREVLESQRPDIDVRRDPTAMAFAVVVAKGFEHIADEAIKARQESNFLENLPRSVLLAFVAKTTDNEPVHLQINSPFRYEIGPSAAREDYLLIPESYRLEGEYLEKVRDLEPEKRDLLAKNIRRWVADQSLTLDVFYTKHRETPQPRVRNEAPGVAENRSSSALERLHAAQPSGVSGRMVIPLDIALALSRLP